MLVFGGNRVKWVSWFGTLGSDPLGSSLPPVMISQPFTLVLLLLRANLSNEDSLSSVTLHRGQKSPALVEASVGVAQWRCSITVDLEALHRGRTELSLDLDGEGGLLLDLA